MPAQHGFFGPRSARGSAALLPEPPWYYSGDLLTIECRVDPDRIARAPARPARAGSLTTRVRWRSSGPTGSRAGPDQDQLLDPVLGQYKEAFVVVRCSYRGETYSRCVYIWVDCDFAIARGLHQGYPEEARLNPQTRPHPYGPAPRVAPGGQVRRLAGGRGPASGRGADHAAGGVADQRLRQRPCHGALPVRPAIDDPSRFRLDEIIATASAEREGGPAFRARVDGFQLFPAPTEELDRLVPEEIIGGYYGRSASSGTAAAAAFRQPGRQIPAEVSGHA